MHGVWGLSGGIASGKSTVANMLMERGGVVIDADQVAREVVEPGTDGLAEIVEQFGEDILLPDGHLNREALGQRVFRNDADRLKLNAILHPKIFLRSLERMQEALNQPARPIFYDAALLVENGAYKNFEGLVIIAAPTEVQLERLMARNQLSEIEAYERLNAQWPMEKKVEVADYVIWNDRDLEHLEAQVEDLIEAIRHVEAAKISTPTQDNSGA